MSDKDDNITPFRLPGDQDKSSEGDSLGDRMKRRRPVSPNIPDEPREWRPSSRSLVMMLLESPHASATIARKEGAAARALDGIEAVLFAGDLSKERNTLGPLFSNEPVLADQEVSYKGQPVAMIIGTSEAVCRKARDLINIDYHPLPGIHTLEHALAMKSFHAKPRKVERGDAEKVIKNAPMSLSGGMAIGSQLPCNPSAPAVEVVPQNQGSSLLVRTTSLLPTLVRSAVATASGLPESSVELDPSAIPGSTAGLELEPVRLAVLATFGALKCRSAISLKLDSAQSPVAAGQRHAAQVSYEVAFTADGTIKAAHLRIAFDAGFFVADSEAILDRALLHADSVYRIPNLRIRGVLCRTNHITSTSMPAEGAAQGAWAMEEIIQRVAEQTKLPAHLVRELNFYQQNDESKTTPYGQPVDAVAIQRVWKHALQRSDYENRVKEVEDWNRGNHSFKRGIAIVPMKFGLGDPRPERNMGMVLIQILPDGSVQVRPGVINLLDGLDRQIREEVSNHLGIARQAVRVLTGDFEVVPQATPVLGVDAAGLILRAIDQACDQLRKRLREVALQLFAARGQTDVEMEAIQFSSGKIGTGMARIEPLTFAEVIEGAWRKRVNLMATGYHRTPNLWWDPELGAGWPFSAFTYAAAVTEIQVDAFTGEIQLLRVDITHEGSASTEQGDRDDAQLFRAFSLGTGWILSEDIPDPEGPPEADFPEEEGVPGFPDAPFQWRTERLRPLHTGQSIPGDPCGEGPVLLAAAVREALWDALRAFGLMPKLEVDLPLPATPPRVLSTCKEIARQLAEREKLAAEEKRKKAEEKNREKEVG